LRDWRPDIYERFYQVTLQPGESYSRDKQDFHLANKNNWIVATAWADWHPDVPAGMVAVSARLRSERAQRGRERYFLVPASEYATSPGDPQHRFGFIIDPDRHKEITSFPSPVREAMINSCQQNHTKTTPETQRS
jgi:hypothetical protein